MYIREGRIVRRLVGMLAVLALVLSIPAQAATATGSSATTRIALLQADARSHGVAARHVLLKGKVSAEVTGDQLIALQQAGVAFEPIPRRSISASAAQGKKDRILPPKQVPYGIKMTYGNPDLTPADISGGTGLKVAVMDTGVLTSHPDFVRADRSKVVTGCMNFAALNADVVKNRCADGNGHGTHVAGTIAAAGGSDGKGVFGVAPQASILAYKVLDDQGYGYADDIARAIIYAADHGANIISMSLGDPTAASVELDAIRYAVGRGVLVIAAAGNEGPMLDTMRYPAAYAEVVAVANLDPSETINNRSSRGITDGDDMTIADREVEVAGPGTYVISTYNTGGYATMTGTSMATPHIAGLAAKMWSGSAAQTRTWLQTQAGAHDIILGYATGPGYDVASGYGLPQAATLSLAWWYE